jgi:hypothetical protein
VRLRGWCPRCKPVAGTKQRSSSRHGPPAYDGADPTVSRHASAGQHGAHGRPESGQDTAKTWKAFGQDPCLCRFCGYGNGR